MGLIDMHVELESYTPKNIERACDTAKKRGLDGIVFAIKDNHEKREVLKIKENFNGLEIMFSQKLRCIVEWCDYYRNKNKCLIEKKTIISSQGEVLIFLIDRLFDKDKLYDMSELKTELIKHKGLVLGINKEEYKTDLREVNGNFDGVIINSQKDYLVKRNWRNFFEKPVYGGTGITTPENVGQMVSKFETDCFKEEMNYETVRAVMMLRDGKYIPFRSSTVKLTIPSNIGLDDYFPDGKEIIIPENEE